jgi:hypothetical protein
VERPCPRASVKTAGKEVWDTSGCTQFLRELEDNHPNLSMPFVAKELASQLPVLLLVSLAPSCFAGTRMLI